MESFHDRSSSSKRFPRAPGRCAAVSACALLTNSRDTPTRISNEVPVKCPDRLQLLKGPVAAAKLAVVPPSNKPPVDGGFGGVRAVAPSPLPFAREARTPRTAWLGNDPIHTNRALESAPPPHPLNRPCAPRFRSHPRTESGQPRQPGAQEGGGLAAGAHAHHDRSRPPQLIAHVLRVQLGKRIENVQGNHEQQIRLRRGVAWGGGRGNPAGGWTRLVPPPPAEACHDTPARSHRWLDEARPNGARSVASALTSQKPVQAAGHKGRRRGRHDDGQHPRRVHLVCRSRDEALAAASRP